MPLGWERYMRRRDRREDARLNLVGAHFSISERSRTTVIDHDHNRADLHPGVEIDHILIG